MYVSKIIILFNIKYIIKGTFLRMHRLIIKLVSNPILYTINRLSCTRESSK